MKIFIVVIVQRELIQGDKEHRLTAIKKVTSGSTHEIAMLVDALYNEIIVAGTHMTDSIRIAEAAKVIENTQRDINIALTNELAIIFNKLGIDTQAVLRLLKAEFSPFKPGLLEVIVLELIPIICRIKRQVLVMYPTLYWLDEGLMIIWLIM